MTNGLASGHVVSPQPARERYPLGRWAIALAWATIVVLAIAYSVFGVSYAVGGEDAVSDTWVGYLAGVSLLGSLAMSLGAFVMALIAKVRRASEKLLWLPLSVFPVLAVVVVLVETLWME